MEAVGGLEVRLAGGREAGKGGGGGRGGRDSGAGEGGGARAGAMVTHTHIYTQIDMLAFVRAHFY